MADNLPQLSPITSERAALPEAAATAAADPAAGGTGHDDDDDDLHAEEVADERELEALLAMEPPREDRSLAVTGGSSGVPALNVSRPRRGGSAGRRRSSGHRKRRRRPKGPRVRVRVQCEGAAVVLPEMALGRCDQTARWLVGVAIQRAARVPHMTRKLKGWRPGGKFNRVHGYYAPERGTVVKPSSKLGDLFGPDAGTPPGPGANRRDLVLQLVPKRTKPRFLTEDTPPVQPTWAAEAFNFSDAGVKRTKELQEKDKADAEERERQLTLMADVANRQKFERLKRLMLTDMQLPATVLMSFESEWGDIRVEALTEDKEEIRMIKNMLCCNWVALSDLYKHYSGSSDVGRTDEMSLVELSHCFMKMAGPEPFINMMSDRSKLAHIFSLVNMDRDPSNDPESLTRFEFVECLIYWAEYKFGEACNNTPLSTAVTRMLCDYVIPAATGLRSGEVRGALVAPDMVGFFTKALPRLRKVFLYYCRTDRSEDDNAHTMSLREFAQMLVDSGIYQRDRLKRRPGDITMKHVRQAFSGVQNETQSRHLEEKLDEEAGVTRMPAINKGKDTRSAPSFAIYQPAPASLVWAMGDGPPVASTLGRSASALSMSAMAPGGAARSFVGTPGGGSSFLASAGSTPTLRHPMHGEGMKENPTLAEMQEELERNKDVEDSTDELVLNEMLEAISRLAVQKKFADDLTVSQKIRRVVAKVCQLDKVLLTMGGVGAGAASGAGAGAGKESELAAAVAAASANNTSSMSLKAAPAGRRGRRRSSVHAKRRSATGIKLPAV